MQFRVMVATVIMIFIIPVVVFILDKTSYGKYVLYFIILISLTELFIIKPSNIFYGIGFFVNLCLVGIGMTFLVAITFK